MRNPGIHYCFVKGFDEMVFAVSPENLPGEYVHPITRSFTDMLSLLLACGSMDAIEQAHMWDEAAFDGYAVSWHYIYVIRPYTTFSHDLHLCRTRGGLTLTEIQRSSALFAV